MYVKLSVARLRAQWRSLLTIMAGVLLVAIVGAYVPLYTSTIAQVAMVHFLERQSPSEVHLFSQTNLSAKQAGDFATVWDSIDERVRGTVAQSLEIGGWVHGVIGWAESASMNVRQGEQELANVRMVVAYYDDWADYVQVVDGALPGEASGESVDVEAALSAEAAAFLGINAGDMVVLQQQGWESSQPVRVQITGVVDAADTDALYWIEPSPLSMTARGAERSFQLLTTRESFARIANEFVPDAASKIGWRVLFDHGALPVVEIAQAEAQLTLLGDRLREPITPDVADEPRLVPTVSLNVVSKVGEKLQQFTGEFQSLDAPFGLVLLQIAVLLLFFLVVTAQLTRRGERREIALLQSRGALNEQIVLAKSIEALILCVAAALVAPFITRQLLVWFAPLFTSVEQLPLSINASTFVWAAAPSLLAFIALVSTLRPVLLEPLVTAGGSTGRGKKQLWWQRYYVDVVLFVIGGAALVQFIQKDSPLVQTLTGGNQADPLLLLAPALLFVAMGSVSLRLFPLVTQVLAKISAHNGFTAALALWQVSREPSHYGRITFLLALSVGIGWFATSFQATIQRSQSDQAGYQVGSDVRVEGLEMALLDPELLSEVEASSAVLRQQDVNFAINAVDLIYGQVLAVDSERFSEVAYWRDDLGALGLPNQAEWSTDIGQTGLALTINPQRIGVWAKLDRYVRENFTDPSVYQTDPDVIYNQLDFQVRLRDAGNRYVEIALLPQSTGEDGWVYLEGVVEGGLQGEVRLDAFYWASSLQNAQFMTSREDTLRTLALKDLTLIGADGQPAVSEMLLDDAWDIAQDFGLDRRLQVEQRVEGDVRVVEWTQGLQHLTFWLIYGYPEAGVIPAIVSRPFAEANFLLEGSRFNLLLNQLQPEFEVFGVTDYFPTLYAEQQPFVVVDLDALLYALNRRPGSAVQSSEVWMKLKPGSDAQRFAHDLGLALVRDGSVDARVLTLEGVVQTQQVDPLSQGLIGLLFMGFAIALAASIVSVFAYAVLTAQERRREFAVLRALGTSTARLMQSIALEQVVVLAWAIVLGGVLGFILSNQVLPSLALSSNGMNITPPFTVQVEVDALAQYGVVLLALLVLVLLSSVLLVRRMSLARSLRYGED